MKRYVGRTLSKIPCVYWRSGHGFYVLLELTCIERFVHHHDGGETRLMIQTYFARLFAFEVDRIAHYLSSYLRFAVLP